MKKHLRILFPLLLGLLVAISAVSIERISDIRDYGKLINCLLYTSDAADE